MENDQAEFNQEALERMETIFKRSEWVEWKEMLLDHQEKLQVAININVKKGDIAGAQVALGKMKDVDKQIDLFVKRKLELQTESKRRDHGDR